MPASMQGFDEMLEALDVLEEQAEDLARTQEPIHDDITKQYREMPIPEVTGRLARSLRNPASPDHKWTPKRGRDGSIRLALISRDPASVFQGHRLGALSYEAIYEIIREHMAKELS